MIVAIIKSTYMANECRNAPTAFEALLLAGKRRALQRVREAAK
jgi:hypothetical protein